MQVFYDNSVNRTIDVCRPGTSVAAFSGETVEAYRKRTGHVAEILDRDEALAREANAALTPWQEISEKAWWNALECMPPLKWDRIGGAESFFICEAYTADVHSCYIKLDGRYFTARRRVGTPKAALAGEVYNLTAPVLKMDAADPEGASIQVKPVPMATLPSTTGVNWDAFVKEPLALPVFDWPSIQKLHEFMRANNTDAVFDGERYLTISRNALWVCEPRDLS